jgi:hypothetical protein
VWVSVTICLWVSTHLYVHDDSPVCGHLDCFQIAVIINKVDMKVYVQVFVWTCIFNSLGQMIKVGLPGSKYIQLYKKLFSNMAVPICIATSHV